jgi:hypothetical protein
MSGSSLSVPGVLHVGMSAEREVAPLHVGPGVGWIALKGIRTWSREISVVLKADVREKVRGELGVTLPEDQPEAARLANAQRAARASNLVAVESSLVDDLVALGVRVHTVGSDQITGGFYYFAKGGAGEAVRVQGNLVEMVAPGLPETADNAAVEECLDGLIARVVAELSDGLLSEAQIELAAALPALGEPAPDALAKLQTLEGFLVVTDARASRYGERARAVVETLGQATRRDDDRVQVPLFGDARSVVQPELEIEYAAGESGERKKLTLPERRRWFVAGLMSETMPPPAVAPSAAEPKADADEAEAARVAAERAAAEKAAADRATVERAAAERAAAERAAAERAAAERVAAEKAAAEKAAAERAAALRSAAEKAAAENAAAEKAAIEKAEADRVAAERALEKEAVRKADEKAVAEAEAEKKAAARAAREAAPKKKSASPTAERAKKPVAAAAKTDARKDPPAVVETGSRLWLWVALVLAAAAGAYYFEFLRGHG